MTKQEQIEEISNIITEVAFVQAHEENGDENLSDIVATALYNAGYRKVSADTLILTENQLKKIIEEEYKKALKGKVVLTTEEYQDLVVKSMDNFSYAMIEARKETAKDILQEWADDNKSMGLDNTYVKIIAEKYGVEIEE